MRLMRLALGSLAVALLAGVVSWLVTAALLPYGVVPITAAVTGIVAMALTLAVGGLLLADRWPPATAPQYAAALVGPVGVALTFLAAEVPLWARLASLTLMVVAAAAGVVAGARRSGARSQPAARRRHEVGSGALEAVGVVTVAAILVAAVVGVVGANDPKIRDTIWAQICSITQGDCPAENAPSAADLRPEECELYTGENKVSATVDVAFVRLGGGGVVQRTEKSNGDIEITMLYEGRGGAVASGGARGGFRVGDTSVQAGWDAEAAATLGVQRAETRVFTDRDEADAFQDYLQRELAEDATYSTVPLLAPINRGAEWLFREEAPKNYGVQKTFVRYDGTVSANASLDFGYGAGLAGEASAMVALGSEFDRGRDAEDSSDDTQTDFYQVEWAAGVEGRLPLLKSAEAHTNQSGVVKVTRNVDGEAVQVVMIDRAQGGFDLGLTADDHSLDPHTKPDGDIGWGVGFTAGDDSSTVVTQTLDLDSPEARESFEGWFSTAAALAHADDATVPFKEATPDNGILQPRDQAADFRDRLARDARVSIVEYDGESWGLGANLSAGLGIKGGFDVSYEDVATTSTKAAYLGAVDAEGVRPSYDLPECVS